MNGHYFYVNVAGTKPTKPSTQGFKKKSEVESVIRVWLYERRERTNFVYYIAFRYPTKSYSKYKFIKYEERKTNKMQQLDVYY